MSRPSRIVVVFVKFPLPGTVKTRLAESLTGGAVDERAAAIYRRLVEAVFATLSRAEFDQLRVCFDPPDAGDAVEAWLAPFLDERSAVFEPQPEGDLGDRLAFAARSALSFAPGARVAMIGTDCVEISPETFRRTWKALDEHDLVFGPAADGGYYLVGLSGFPAEIFEGVPWSSGETLGRSVARAEAAGRKVALLEILNDVDTAGDWEVARARIEAIPPDR